MQGRIQALLHRRSYLSILRLEQVLIDSTKVGNYLFGKQFKRFR